MYTKSTPDKTTRVSDLCRRYRISEDVIAQRLDNETVIVNAGTNRFYRLNDTGSRFWEFIGSGGEERGIEMGLLSEFDTDAATVSAAAEAFVASLAQERLIVVRQSRGRS